MVVDLVEQPAQGTEELGLTDQSSAPAGTDSAGVEEPVYEIDGEQVKLSDIKTWKQGNMMQSDYTRKSQEVAAQRDALKPYQEMAEYLKANPNHAQAIYEYLSGNPSALQGQEVGPMAQKLQGLEQTQKFLFNQIGKLESDRLLGEIKSDQKYGGVFSNPKIEEVLLATHLQKGRGNNLKETADELFGVLNSLQASTKLETEKKLQANLASPTRKSVGGAGTMNVPKGFDPSQADWKELEKRALESL